MRAGRQTPWTSSEAQAAQVGGKEQRLHFVGNGQFAFQPLLLFLLGDQVAQRLRHRVERLLQRRHLIATPDLDAMLQLALVYILGRGVQLGYRPGHAARKPSADNQSDQLDDAEENADAEKRLHEDSGILSQTAEQRAVQQRGPGVDN